MTVQKNGLCSLPVRSHVLDSKESGFEGKDAGTLINVTSSVKWED